MLVLLSGGLDSTTALAIAKTEGFKCYAMSFCYEQRHKVESDRAREVAQMVVAKHVIVGIDLRQFGAQH